MQNAYNISRAVELYRGELLSGYYENWILPEQQRLEELFFDVLDETIICLEEADDLNRAIHYARWGVSVDPLREEAHRELIRLCAAAGQHDVALQQYEELERILKQKLGIAPSAATRALIREISEQLAVGNGFRAVPCEQLVLVSGGRSVVSRQKVESRKKRLSAQPLTVPTPSSHAAVLQFSVSRHQPSTINHQPSSLDNLPLQFTRFFGREEDIARLRETLLPVSNHPTPRLVTLTGAGGSGKTRLAIEVAGCLRDEFAGGAWFVPLSDVSDARLIVDAMRNTLRLPRSPHAEPLEQIVEMLSEGERHGVRSLLILDNFEQLAAASAPVVLTLMKRIPSLTIMVTSRRRLGLPGEREFMVSPLPLPAHPHTRTPDDVRQRPVVRGPRPSRAPRFSGDPAQRGDGGGVVPPSQRHPAGD